MRIWHMVTTGGKAIVVLLSLILMTSCDLPWHVTNSGLQLNVEGENIIVYCARYTNNIYFTFKSEKEMVIAPDSLKIQFSNQDTAVRDLEFSTNNKLNPRDNKVMSDKRKYYVSFKIMSKYPIYLDTVTLIIPPSQYLTLDGKQVLTDTLYFPLKQETLKYTFNSR